MRRKKPLLVSKESELIKTLKLKILSPLKKHMHEQKKEGEEDRKIRIYTAVAITKVS